MALIEVLLLSRQDVVDLNLEPLVVMGVVERALREHAEGAYEMHPKIGVHPTETDPANFIHAMPAYLPRLRACGLKWVGGFARNFERGLPNVTGVQVLNDPDTGVPLAVMDCSFLTGMRTAAVSTIAARCCARSNPRTLALVGCGFEGTKHLEYLVTAFPGLQELRLRDVRDSAMNALKERIAEQFSGPVRVCSDEASCLEGADIICTCTNGEVQIVRPEWFGPGAFGVAIEGGCAYTAEALHQADRFLVDDVPLAEYFDRIGRDRLTADGRPDPEFPGGMPEVAATIGQVVAGQRPGRLRDEDRVIAVPIGMSICDVAVAQLIYETASNLQVGESFALA
ncbi:MAG: ornithine cyclodeaminase family protein [Pirellulales bacterium]